MYANISSSQEHDHSKVLSKVPMHHYHNNLRVFFFFFKERIYISLQYFVKVTCIFDVYSQKYFDREKKILSSKAMQDLFHNGGCVMVMCHITIHLITLRLLSGCKMWVSLSRKNYK